VKRLHSFIGVFLFASIWNYSYAPIDVRLVKNIEQIIYQEDSMEQFPRQDVLDLIKKHDKQTYKILNEHAVVVFYDLSISDKFKNSEGTFRAVTCTRENSSKLYILIDNKYKASSKYALATVIAHECLHVSRTVEKLKNNLTPEADTFEEVEAFNLEVDTWLKYRKLKDFKSFITDELEQKENYLLMLRNAGNLDSEVERIYIGNK
jgi:hypothetical protein